jgi:hypothetical protein
MGRALSREPNLARAKIRSPNFSEDAERAAGCEVALDVECAVDGGVNGQETLGGSRRLWGARDEGAPDEIVDERKRALSRRRRVVDAVGCNHGSNVACLRRRVCNKFRGEARRRDRGRGGEWQCGAHSLRGHRFPLPPNRRARARHRSTRGRDRRSRARGTRRRWRCSCRSRSPGRRPCGRRAPRAGRSP